MGHIDLTAISSLPNPNHFDFNTELIFEDCTINSFNASTRTLGRPITFKRCKIGAIWCHGTYFHGGLNLLESVVDEFSSFDCGVHNWAPNKFVINHCVFHDFLDFFDVFFQGPIEITNNDFKAGTNINLYIDAPYGREKGTPVRIENNRGQLDKYADRDPTYPEYG